jgi:CRISPR-associated protein Csm2
MGSVRRKKDDNMEYNKTQNKSTKNANKPFHNSVGNITKENYYDEAKQVMETLKDGTGRIALTTSQIRNLFAMASEIYNEIYDPVIEGKLIEKINKLRTRMTYEMGRNPTTGDFIRKSGLLNFLNRVKSEKEAKKAKETFVLFHNYFEALVAFHKFYGGKD